MKRLILITFSLLIIVVPASADFVDDFNRNAKYWEIEQATKTDGSYMSGSVLISQKDGTTIIGGKDPVETLAVACCALDSIELNENFIIAGRIFEAYLHALKSEEKRSYYALHSFKVKVYVVIQDDMIFVALVE